MKIRTILSFVLLCAGTFIFQAALAEFSPGGNYELVTRNIGWGERRTVIYDVVTKQEIFSLPPSYDYSEQKYYFSPYDDRFFVVKEDNNTFSVWEIKIDKTTHEKFAEQLFEYNILRLDSVQFYKKEDCHYVVVDGQRKDGSEFACALVLEYTGEPILKAE
jgi:hypothetical protein